MQMTGYLWSLLHQRLTVIDNQIIHLTAEASRITQQTALWRRCSTCGQYRLRASEFYRRGSGYQSACKACHRSAVKRSRAAVDVRTGHSYKRHYNTTHRHAISRYNQQYWLDNRDRLQAKRSAARPSLKEPRHHPQITQTT